MGARQRQQHVAAQFRAMGFACSGSIATRGAGATRRSGSDDDDEMLPAAACGSDSDRSVNGGGATTRCSGNDCMWWRVLPPRLCEDAMAAVRPSNAGAPPSPLLLSALPFPPISLFLFFYNC
ncbi:uncharacterized protein DS421_15g518580 [Arachis hypogaea]|nr:uncharacterized protein DS421_15g518580 [Arachis hypogaea]